jgi:hypothetical protein
MLRCLSVELLLVIIYLALLLLIKTSYYVDVDFGVERSAFFSDSATVRVEDCILPDYEPFHSSVKALLRNPPPLNCSKFQFALTFVDSNRAIYVNASAVNELKKQNPDVDDVKCYYKAITRTHDESKHDDKVNISEDEVIQFNCLL